MTTHSLAQTVSEYSIDFTRLLYMQYMDIDYAIRQADVKAQVILGVNAILLVAKLNGVASAPTIGGQFEPVLIALDLLVFLSLLLSVFFALFALLPRFKNTQADNVFYFGSIMQFSEADYIAAYRAMSLEEVKDTVMAQIHAKSHIAARKFRTVRVSLLCLFASVPIWIMSYSIGLLSS